MASPKSEPKSQSTQSDRTNNKIKFSKTLYSKEAVAEGIDAFSQLLKCELVEDSAHLTVILSPLEKDAEEDSLVSLKDELCNYVLAATINSLA